MSHLFYQRALFNTNVRCVFHAANLLTGHEEGFIRVRFPIWLYIRYTHLKKWLICQVYVALFRVEATRVSRRKHSRGCYARMDARVCVAYCNMHACIRVAEAVARIVEQECSQIWKFNTFLRRDTAA